MTSARSDILAGIRRSLRRGPLQEDERTALFGRVARHERHIIPARVNRSPAALVELFAEKAGQVAATLDRIAAPEGAAEAVARYLARENLPARIVQAPAVPRLGVRWSDAPTVEVRTGTAHRDDQASVTVALAGIAETGTLMLASGPETPTGLNFVPPHHIVIVRRCDIVASWEDAWDLVRARAMPRVGNFSTGPSRTGDIEQRIQIGVHGPLRLHVIMSG